MTRHLWDEYQHQNDLDALERHCRTAGDRFYLAVLAFADGAHETAARYAAEAAHEAPASLLYPAAAEYLATVGKQGRQQVYTNPAAFEAFIRGGGNIDLYEALSAALRRRYTRSRPASLLDIGVGDGLALLPALGPEVGHVDLLEPSSELLATTAQALTQRDVSHRAANASIQQAMTGIDAWPEDTRWDLVQATFALHNATRSQRRDVLAWLRSRTDRLLVAEFDLTPGESCDPDWVEYVTTRYETGLAEYDGDGGFVAQGFLMPIMFGYFDPGTIHHEQSLAEWRDDLAEAGFADQREPEPLYDYWWAPGYLLDAS